MPPRKQAAVLCTCPRGYLLAGRVVDVDVRRFGEHCGAEKSSAQVTSLSIDPGLSAAMPFAPALFTWTADWRHHDLSCYCALPTSL